MVLVGFSHEATDWHGLEGCGILHYRLKDLMYITSLWISNCGDCMNALTFICRYICCYALISL